MPASSGPVPPRLRLAAAAAGYDRRMGPLRLRRRPRVRGPRAFRTDRHESLLGRRRLADTLGRGSGRR